MKREWEAQIRKDSKIVIVTSLEEKISHLTKHGSEEKTCKLDLYGSNLNVDKKINRKE